MGSNIGGIESGYVTRNLSVQEAGFSQASVALGEDIVISGRNSSVFGGKHHTLSGQYSAILGGQSHVMDGNYSVILGGQNDSVLRSYVINVNGQNNEVSSNYTVLLASDKNQLSGSHQTIIGHNNLVNGEDVFVFGNNNQVNADRVTVIGDGAMVNFPKSFIINQSSTQLAQPTQANQIMWMLDNGVAINTMDHSEALVVSGSVKADYFYGRGSQLSNVSFVDKYWLLNKDIMTLSGYWIGLGTVLKRDNKVNLKSGLILSSDGSSVPGTLSYEYGDLVGYGERLQHILYWFKTPIHFTMCHPNLLILTSA